MRTRLLLREQVMEATTGSLRPLSVKALLNLLRKSKGEKLVYFAASIYRIRRRVRLFFDFGLAGVLVVFLLFTSVHSCTSEDFLVLAVATLAKEFGFCGLEAVACTGIVELVEGVFALLIKALDDVSKFLETCSRLATCVDRILLLVVLGFIPSSV